MRLNLKNLLVLLLAVFTSGLISAQTKATTKSLGIDVSGMDRSVRPQDDFFRFVNGAWVDRTAIPADRSSYGSFPILSEKSETEVRGIIEGSAAKRDSAHGSETQKIGELYRSFMDTARIESLGVTPLKGELSRIADADKASLSVEFARLSKIGVRTLPYAVGVSQDPKKSDTYIVSIGQGGLGMPDRDYYLRKDDKFAAIRKSYTDYISNIFKLANEPDPQGAAQRIL